MGSIHNIPRARNGSQTDLKPTHKKKTLQKAKAQKRQIYPLINRSSSLSLKTKVLLYKSFILPIILYACPAWATASKSHIRPLQSIQNLTLRQIANAPWYVRNSTLHRDLKIIPIADLIQNITRKQFEDIPLHPNQLLIEATTYNAEDINTQKTKITPVTKKVTKIPPHEKPPELP